MAGQQGYCKQNTQITGTASHSSMGHMHQPEGSLRFHTQHGVLRAAHMRTYKRNVESVRVRLYMFCVGR